MSVQKPISMTDLVTSERKVFAVGSRHEPVTVVDSVSQTSKKPKPNFRRTYETAKNTQNGDFRLIWQCRTFSYIVMRNVTKIDLSLLEISRYTGVGRSTFARR